MLTGILKVLRLPPKSTWRFLASLYLSVAGQILIVQRVLRQRVWEAAHIQLKVSRSIPTPPCTPCSAIRWAGAKSYNPKNRGKKSFQPIMTFPAETREYIAGELRNGDRPTAPRSQGILESVFAGLPPSVKTIYARADSGFYCAEAVEA
jgi:hypothetical protein